MFGSMGIEVVDSEQKYREKSEGEEGAELDLTPGALDKTNDPVRMYLREMGTVPLLTREGEVEIAKRIERGKKIVMKVICRTPMAAQEVARYTERLAASEINVRDMVVFNEEEVTEEKIEAKVKETLKLSGQVAEAHKDYLAYRKKFLEIGKREPKYVRAKLEAGPPAHRGVGGHPPHRVQRGGEAPPDRARARVGGAHPRGRGQGRASWSPSSAARSRTSTRRPSASRSTSSGTSCARSRTSSTPAPTSSRTR